MKSITGEKIRTWLLSALMVHGAVAGNPDAKRLYDDLLSNYNKLVRPVVNTTDVLKVCIKLKLSQLIDVNLKNQIMTTNLWVEQSWYDYKLRWEPKEYGGVHMLHVPSDHIWRPDIVLYNNADGNFEVTLATKATIYSEGLVEWKPPAIYKSSCEIDVEYFPFDEQTCVLKFGSWTYDGFKVDLRHMDEQLGSNVVDVGVDLSEFYMSVEWDILEVPAVSICVTVVVLNVHFRSPQTHRMAPWVKNVFIDSLPKFLFIKRPKYNFETSLTSTGPFGGSCQIHGLIPSLAQSESDDLPVVPDMEIGPSGIKSPILANPVFSHTNCPPSVHRSCFCVQFISEHTRMQEDSTKVKEDWKYVAMVLDRLFLWIFTLAVLAGTAGIILQAPTLYDDRIPIIEQKDVDFSGNSAGRCRPPQ
ncbi:acetylcholine receptor subunit alpha-like isoform X3 [Musca domestica]|uniref:Acetylcholine receptor subunit alpha-like isoform X3 n=1 Tax=Musca domestica TaxID=7370 RepID=A0ABM3VAZ2_MUSDO|nr:acetylcholine receptor subunit alpha-like isoform X3 [Musca domestica]